MDSKLSLSRNNNYWLYIISDINLHNLVNYEEPYFTIPNNENIQNEMLKIGDIIIFLVSNRTSYGFIGFSQLNSKVMGNKKIKIFKDAFLNFNYVTLKFRLFCSNPIKLNTTLKELNIKDNDDFTSSVKFTRKYAKKHMIMSLLPPINGRIIINYLIKYKNNEIIKDDEEVSSSCGKFSKSDKFEKSNKSNNKNNNKKKEYTSSDNSNSSDLNSSNDSNDSNDTNDSNKTNDKIESPGLIPIMITPCKNFNIDDPEDKIDYFMNHYTSCKKCVITNNNDIELGSIINNCNWEFHEIQDKKNGYFNPALEQYSFGENYEPIDSLEYPFVRILYINNDHEIYDKCLLVCWIV